MRRLSKGLMDGDAESIAQLQAAVPPCVYAER
jgi:hypothetical protein